MLNILKPKSYIPNSSCFKSLVLLIICSLFVQLHAQLQVSKTATSATGYVAFTNQNKPSFTDWQLVLHKLTTLNNQTTWQIYQQFNDELNQTHYRVQQYYKGTLVDLGQLVLHVLNNKILAVNGQVVFVKEKSVILNKQEALNFALQLVPAKVYKWQNAEENQHLQIITQNKDTNWLPNPKLTYCSKNFDLLQEQQLCYSMLIYAEEPLLGQKIYVNAQTGELVASENLILHTNVIGKGKTAFSDTQTLYTDSIAPGSFRLRETTHGGGIETYNMKRKKVYAGSVDFTDTDNFWHNVNVDKDEAATDAHFGAERTWSFFNTILNRNSYDNNGGKLLSFVHYDSIYQNAYWNGIYMTYGDGNPAGYINKPLTSLDVCGHELAHGVTGNSAGLIYSNESGQLNESFSDIFGNAVERWATPKKFNWKIGEDITSTGNGIRNMSNPNAYNNPRYYKGVKWYFGSGDNGGVHYNSGVQNYWYYLISDGIAGTNEVGNNFDIDSLGYITAAKIAYRNLNVYLTKSSQHTDARFYSILAATDLYGSCSKEVISTTNAWWVCGVGNKYDSGYVKANFRADSIACFKGKLLTFTNKSINALKATWYFGDGNSSNLYNTTHSYANFGTYTVKLVVESCFNSKKDSITKLDYVIVDSTFDICNAAIMPLTGTDSVYKCKGFIYDHAGEEDYKGNVKSTLLVQTFSDSIQFRFLDLNYENGYDSVVLFIDNTNNANKIGKYTGNIIPFGGLWQTVAGSSLWLKHYSDPFAEGRGFKIEYKGIRKEINFQLPNDTTICLGNNLDLKPTITNAYLPDLFFKWNTNEITSSINVKPTSKTKYTLTVFDNCAKTYYTDSIWVTVLDSLKLILPADTTICYGNSVNLNCKTIGGKIAKQLVNWQPTNYFGKNYLITPKATIKLTVTLSDGCTVKNDTQKVTITVLDSLKIDLTSPDTLVCIQKKANLSTKAIGGKNSAYVYNWSPILPLTATNSPIVNANTWFKVTLTDGCTVKPAIDSILIKTHPPIKGSIANDTLACLGAFVPIWAIGSGGNGSTLNYNWSSGQLTSSFSQKALSQNLFIVTISDGCSPSWKDTLNLTVKLPLQLNTLKDTTLCFGQTYSPTILPIGGNAATHAIQWIPNNVSGFNPIFNTLGVQNYTATLSDGCTENKAFLVVKITNLPPLQITSALAKNPICETDSSNLSLILNGGLPLSYVFKVNGMVTTNKTMVVKPIVTTLYTIDLTDGCSLPVTENINLIVHQKVNTQLVIDNNKVCLGQPQTFSLNPNTNYSTIWYLSNGDSFKTSPFTYTFNKTGTYTTKAKVTTINGCFAFLNLADTAKIIAYPKVKIDASPTFADLSNPTFIFTNNGTKANNYDWDFRDGNTSNQANSVGHLFADTGKFDVILKLTNLPNCSHSDTVRVIVYDQYKLFIPNSFSPNSNNLNEIYLPKGVAIQSFKMSIYNRWGEQVFYTDNIQKGWNGEHTNGAPMPSGQYIVIIQTVDIKNEAHAERIVLNLFR